MGQATVDLPDPSLDPPLEPVLNDNPASADDLLSLLAGEEIERMLSDADASLTQPAPDTESADPLEALDRPADATENDLPPAITTETPTAEPHAILRQQATLGNALSAEPSADPIVPVEAELDALLERLTETKSAPAAEQPVTLESSVPTAAAIPAETAATSEAASASTLSEDHASADEAPLPLYLRPLEWLNAPMAWCPESVRNLLGMIAIITTINALSVLLYVLIFKR